MSRIRDIANLFSGNTDAATDAEVTAAINSHNTTANGHVKRGNTASRPASPSNGDVYMNTQLGYPEFYNGSVWIPIGATPTAPTSVVATNQGTGRAFNNGQASVAFTAGTVPGSTYTVTSNPGNYYNTGSTSSIIVTGLQSSTVYTFSATASSVYGTSTASSPSSEITITTVPQAPVIGTVSVTNGTTISLPFTVNNGGSAISSISITSSPSLDLTYSGTSSPVSITGSFAQGQAYTFTMTATNSNGTSLSSTSSNSVTPLSLATVTGGTLTSDATYYYRTFTSNGTLDISGLSITADILMVAGGGGSGWDAGGGGGAGGVIIGNNKILSTGSYPITIGNGGTYSSMSRGSSGSNTTGFGWTALGGGGGGYYNAQQSGLPGGSGGGGVSSTNGTGGAATQTSGSGYTGYGNAGGSGSSSYNSGGGGGAGGAGQNSGGAGGLPLYSTQFNNTGASIAYAGGGYGNTDGGSIYDTGYNQSNTYVGYYGFGANGQGDQTQLNSNKNGNPGIVVVRYTKAQVV